MAADTEGSQTEYLIEVSQDSPIAKLQSVARDEVVEDSLKDIPEAYQGGTVKMPQAPLSDDEDDLYSETPEAKERRLSSNSTSAKTGEAGPSMNTARQERLASDLRKDKQGRVSQRQLQTPWKPRTALEDDQVDDLAGDDDRLTAHMGSLVKSSQKQKRGTKGSVAQTPNMSKATAAANGSARAALLARRQAQNGMTDGISESRMSAVRKAPTASTEDPKTNQKDLRAPAPQPSTNTEVGTRPKSVNLTARKAGTLKSAPRPSRAGEGVSINGDDTDGTDELRKDPGQPYRSVGQSTKKGALKTPQRRGLPQTVRKKSSYDVEESLESQKSNEETYGFKASKGPRGRQPRSAVNTVNQTTTSRATQRASSNRTTARRQNIQREQSPGKVSVRSRMKAESNVNETERPESSVKSTSKAKSTANSRPKQPDGPPGTAKGSKPRPKPVDRVEDPAMHYDDNEDRCDGDDACQDGREDLPHAKREKSLDGNPAIDDGDFNEGTTRPANSETLTRREGARQHRRLSAQHHSNADVGFVAGNQNQKTPTAPGSSPPPLTGPAMAEVMRKKPVVIAFDKSGPQNQGTLFTKDGAPTSARKSRSSVPPGPIFTQPKPKGLDRLEQQAERQQIGTRASKKSRQTNQPITQANVAKDVQYALTDLARRNSSTQAQIAPVSWPPTDDVPQDGRQGESFTHLAAADNEFITIDDFESPTMLAEEITVAAKPQSRPVPERTRSQIQMPPPAAPRSPKAQLPTTVAGAASHITFDPSANAKRSSASEAKPAAKRAHDGDTTHDPASKRPRAHALLLKGSQQPTRESRSTSIDLDEQRKPNFPLGTVVPVPEPEKRPLRKPSRQRSRRSQTVDMQGSPIPEGLTIQAKATALEAYSQQADLSPDGILDGEIVTVKRTDKVIEPTATSQEIVPPSHQPEPMSSNKKKKPTGPEEESRGVERVVRADQRRLVENEAGDPSTDPFTSADEQRKQPREGSTSSELLMRFEQQVYHEVVARIQQHPSTPRIPEEVIAEIRRGPFRRQFQEAPAAAGGREPGKHDPEKTLVEEESRHRRHKRKRAPSISTTSSDSSDSTPGTPTSVHDLGTWRNALQPHQMNVFDGLVILSHKLVRHLVDAETAAKDVNDEYHRRAMNIIKQMELSQASAYEKFQNSIQSTKKQLRRGYIDCAERLEEEVAAIRAAQRERREISKRREGVVETLQDFMAQVC